MVPTVLGDDDTCCDRAGFEGDDVQIQLQCCALRRV